MIEYIFLGWLVLWAFHAVIVLAMGDGESNYKVTMIAMISCVMPLLWPFVWYFAFIYVCAWFSSKGCMRNE